MILNAKKDIIVKLCGILLLSTSVYGAVAPDVEQMAGIDSAEVTALVAEVRTRLPAEFNPITGPKVVFVGGTGSGKSTTINLVMGKSLKVVEINLQESFDLQEGVEGLKIGHDESETMIPAFLRDASIEGGAPFYDTPGLESTEGLAQELANTSLIKSLFECGPTKMVWVVLADDFMRGLCRGIRFRKLLETIVFSIDDISSHVKSVSLVISQCDPGTTLAEMLEQIDRLTSEDTKLSPRLTGVLKSMVENGLVSIAHKPLDKAESRAAMLSADRAAILDMISRMRFGDIRFAKLSLSSDSLSEVQDMFLSYIRATARRVFMPSIDGLALIQLKTEHQRITAENIRKVLYCFDQPQNQNTKFLIDYLPETYGEIVEKRVDIFFRYQIL